MSSVSALLSEGAATLSGAGINGANRDAQILLAHACGCEPSRLTMLDDISFAEAEAFREMIVARAKFQPVSQIIGYREFWGRRVRVTPDVLDPETETLIEQALAVGGSHILDLGTGSGAIAVTLACEMPQAEVTATDISAAALDVARQNADSWGAQVRFLQADWWDGVAGQFDLIVSNPPYITAMEMAELSRDVREWEPHLALTPGEDGLDAYRKIAACVAEFLTPGGTVLLEIGHLQGAAVSHVFKSSSFESVKIYKDLDGRDRLVAIKS